PVGALRTGRNDLAEREDHGKNRTIGGATQPKPDDSANVVNHVGDLVPGAPRTVERRPHRNGRTWRESLRQRRAQLAELALHAPSLLERESRVAAGGPGNDGPDPTRRPRAHAPAAPSPA